MNTNTIKEKKDTFETKRNGWYIAGMLLGLLLAVLGICLQFKEIAGMNKAIPGILMGIGSGMLGGCTAELINHIMRKKKPEIAYQKQIDYTDERNTLIRDKAKSKALSLLQYIYCIMILIFTLMNVGLSVMLISVGVLLLGNAIVIYYITKLNKEL